MFSHRINAFIASIASTLFGAAIIATSVTGAQAQAPAPPTPLEMSSGLDLECYRTPGPSLDINVNLSHLNPVLIDLGLPSHQVIVRELVQTCVPVRKNESWPAAAALPFIRHVDLACYRVDAAPLPDPQPLALTHLNPVLAGLPQHGVVLQRPAQLCVPVAKNGVLPPPEILALVRHINLECYDTIPGAHPPFGVGLSQLNPQLQGIAPHGMALVSQPRQLCVPVAKTGQENDIPQAIRDRIQWIDLEKFKAGQNVVIAPTNVTLNHINPNLVNQPPVPVLLQEANSLLVPVAKNGQIPPND